MNRTRGPTTWISGDVEKFYRSERQDMAELFNEIYIYGAVNSDDQRSRSSNDRRTLIWSGGCDPWPVASSGITWLAVHGERTICVVVKKQDVDKARLGGCFWRFEPSERILRRFMTTIIFEMEDPSSELHQRFKCVKNRSKMTSFAAVSVALGSDGIHEESGHEPKGLRHIKESYKDSNIGDGERAAIHFLRKEIKNDPAFTYEKTIQTAISALQYLHQEKFKATDILVEIWMKGKHYGESLGQVYIEEHLAVICEKMMSLTASGCSKKLKRSSGEYAYQYDG